MLYTALKQPLEREAHPGKIVREELLDILSELEKISEISDKFSEKFSDDSETCRDSPAAIRCRAGIFDVLRRASVAPSIISMTSSILP